MLSATGVLESEYGPFPTYRAPLAVAVPCTAAHRHTSSRPTKHHPLPPPPTVCDLYAEWAGPCKAVRETFKKLMMERGEGSGGGLPLRFLTVGV